MRLPMLTIFAALGLVAGLIWQAPLSFVLRQAGVASTGLTWSQARGSISHGQITDMAIQERNIGALDLRLVSSALLSGSLKYRATWSSPFGSGNGKVALNASRYIAEDVSIRISFSEIPDIIEEFKQVNASIRMTRGTLDWHLDEGCRSAIGELQTDLVRLMGQRIQKSWPDLVGDVSCDGNQLVAQLSGQSSNNEKFSVQFYMTAYEPVRYTAQISGMTQDEANALVLYGFKREGNLYTLRGNSLAGNIH